MYLIKQVSISMVDHKNYFYIYLDIPSSDGKASFHIVWPTNRGRNKKKYVKHKWKRMFF